MAEVDELVEQIADASLRARLTDALATLRRKKKFGLVYESHSPESVCLAADAGVRVGSQVLLRKQPANSTRYSVVELKGTSAVVSDGTQKLSVKTADLFVVKPFGEAVYPVLKQIAKPVLEGQPGRPFHTVISGENFHALQLLLFGYEKAVDCIYIDPPYNTGDKSWRYNNDYVDENDAWRHSKWLSMMERRLKLAGRLLTEDGVLIVTIDEHEVQTLGLLLRQVYPQARVQMVTIVTNTAGSMSPGLFSRADEYAYFCFFGKSKPAQMATDMLSESKPVTQFWFPLFRSRGLNDRPSKRPNLVYPVAVDPKTLKIVGTGKPLKERKVKGDLDKWSPPLDEKHLGCPVVWPVLDSGEVSTWQVNPEALMKLQAEGFVRVRKSKKESGPRPFTISYVKSGNQKLIKSGQVAIKGKEANGAYILEGGARTTIPKTVWKIAAHDARLYGSTMLRSLVGPSAFTYPKSPYATADAIHAVVADNKDAVILDFFAGSGTTVQAVAMLNRLDGGRRRCIAVTNNEVTDAIAVGLNEKGLFVGDEKFEAEGICRTVTIPRVTAAFTGLRTDGSPVEDTTYLDGTPVSDGLEENAAFFEMSYENADRIEVGERFEMILPSLWLSSGAVGDPTSLKVEKRWFLSKKVPFGVLLDEDALKPFLAEVGKLSHLTHLWLVTDSESAFARMRTKFSKHLRVDMLYRDYLRNFRANVEVV